MQIENSVKPEKLNAFVCKEPVKKIVIKSQIVKNVDAVTVKGVKRKTEQLDSSQNDISTCVQNAIPPIISDTLVLCHICGLDVESITALDEHLVTDHQELEVSAYDVCHAYSSSSRDTLDVHNEQRNFKFCSNLTQVPAKCQYCNEILEDKYLLKEHCYAQFLKTDFCCKKCEKLFSSFKT